jgi:serine/threonine protein kinase
MHAKGVVHRDMNPTNIFIHESKVKILDFNVSKLIEKDTDYNTSSEEHRFKYSLFTKTGTPIYTAPEIHSAGRYRYGL